MSLVNFNQDTKQFRVFLPSVKKLPPNPHFGQEAEALQRALAVPSETTNTDSEVFPEPPEDKALRHRLLASDQRSFLTGSASADLQAAHVINVVRRDLSRKKRVEDLLSQQKLQDPSLLFFALDNPTNTILLEASLHIHWNLYGTFCIVPSERDAHAMLDEFKIINDRWAAYNPTDNFVRPLDITQPPFANVHWDIVVLYPTGFLPDSQPLSIALDRTLYTPGQPPPVSSLTWTSWIAEGDCLVSVDQRTPLAPFVVDNIRSLLGTPILSPLAVVINAFYKLNQFMRDHGSTASDRVQTLAQLMSELVTAIFFVPQGYGRKSDPQGLQVPLAAYSATQLRLGPSQTASSLGPQVQQGDMGSYGSGLGSNNPMDSAHDAQDRVDSPEIPGEDGLTDSEFNAVAARANDSFLDPKDRAEAAILMLFGTRRYEIPSVHSGLP